MVKDLNKDDVPDFIREGRTSMGPKTNIRDVFFVGLEDESIQKYKERLLGNL
jgi:hypothetical protein